MPVRSRITPFLWLEHSAETAARFYCSLFPNSAIEQFVRLPEPSPSGDAVASVTFVLDGLPLIAFNGGPHFRLNEAFSLQVDCADQTEVDRLWEALTTDGGQAGHCGWLVDRFGVSWQIVPRGLIELLSDPDRGRSSRATQAMFGMSKLDIAELHRAADAND